MTVGKYILAIDQSTTTTKAILFDQQTSVVARCDVQHRQISPQKGWVEHDPKEIWHNIVEAVREVIETSGVDKRDIAYMAVTNQRETTVMWTPDGEPVYNAIVWQCSRAEYIMHRPEIEANGAYIAHATGLQPSPFFSAAKACWIKEHCCAKPGMMFGNMDSWVIWNLTGKHVTDYSNASRTQLFNIRELKWDEKLLKLFGLEDVEMPEVHFSDEIYGYTTVDGIFDEPIPVAGDMGDSHGALFAQMCWEKGMGKCSFGTGGSIMVNIGDEPTVSANRMNTSVAWGLNKKVKYVFEGTIVCMGDTIRWLKDEAGLITSSKESEEFATHVDSSDGVYLIPAFTGLGAPYWESNARAMICGMNRFTNKYHIVRAGLESIAYQMRDIIDPMMKDAHMTLDELRVDGGPTNNRFLMQFTADILNTRIVRNSVEELSALGAAFAGGLATGYFKDYDEIATLRRTNAEYSRQMPAQKAEQFYQGWKDNVAMLLGGIKHKC